MNCLIIILTNHSFLALLILNFNPHYVNMIYFLFHIEIKITYFVFLLIQEIAYLIKLYSFKCFTIELYTINVIKFCFIVSVL